jgi:uncharacterized coiled-coil DUF342 family protein
LVESLLLRKIKKYFGHEAAAKEIANRINARLQSGDQFSSKIQKISKQVQSVEGKIQNSVKAVANGLDISMAKPEIDSLKIERETLVNEIRNLESKQAFSPKPVTWEQILNMYSRLEEAIESYNPAKNENC